MRATTPGEVIMMTCGVVSVMLAEMLGIAFPYVFLALAFLYVHAVLKERAS